jgi:hypothetical protein
MLSVGRKKNLFDVEPGGTHSICRFPCSSYIQPVESFGHKMTKSEYVSIWGWKRPVSSPVYEYVNHGRTPSRSARQSQQSLPSNFLETKIIHKHCQYLTRPFETEMQSHPLHIFNFQTRWSSQLYPSAALPLVIIITIIIININDRTLWSVPSPQLQLLSPTFLRSSNCSSSLWSVMIRFQRDSV